MNGRKVRAAGVKKYVPPETRLEVGAKIIGDKSNLKRKFKTARACHAWNILIQSFHVLAGK